MKGSFRKARAPESWDDEPLEGDICAGYQPRQRGTPPCHDYGPFPLRWRTSPPSPLRPGHSSFWSSDKEEAEEERINTVADLDSGEETKDDKSTTMNHTIPFSTVAAAGRKGHLRRMRKYARMNYCLLETYHISTSSRAVRDNARVFCPTCATLLPLPDTTEYKTLVARKTGMRN